MFSWENSWGFMGMVVALEKLLGMSLELKLNKLMVVNHQSKSLLNLILEFNSDK